MRNSKVIIFYQNLLFAEILESALLKNDFRIIKSELGTKNGCSENNLSFSGEANLILVESNLPFPIFDKLDMINRQFPENESKIVLIVNIVNQRLIEAIHQGKVNGVILKSCDFEEFLFAIKQVLDDKKYFSSIIADVMVRNNHNSNHLNISKRERQILSLIAEMNSTSQIAEKLLISISTVKTHRRNLMMKLKAKNLLCLLRIACRENLLNDNIDYCGCCYRQYGSFYN